jgi:hypothetical protein
LKKYIGDTYADKKHGKGTLSWSDGRIYTGAFYADKRNGFGTFQTKDVSEFNVKLILTLEKNNNFFYRVFIVMMNDLVPVS